jgi:hypothetical protein
MAAKPTLWWQRWGNAAQIGSAVVAAFGFGAVLFQINEIRVNGRAASARQSYLGYMDMAFKNPAYSAPNYAKIKAAGGDEMIRYENFVNYFLYSCEEAMATLDRAGEWSEACAYDLKYHLSFLCDRLRSEPNYLSTYNSRTRELIKSSMQRFGVKAPECKLAG